MDALVPVSSDKEQQLTIMGRDLHEVLGICTNYMDWFSHMCGYDFIEGTDFLSTWKASPNGYPRMDHQMTIGMAKRLCMIQYTELGKKCLEYLIELERRWNSSETIMDRALRVADQQIELVREQNARLLETAAVQAQRITELEPKASYYDVVLACKELLPISQISKDYGWSAQKMNKWLNKQKIQYKQGDIWLMYQKYAGRGYTNTKTHVHLGKDGAPHTTVHTYWTQSGRLFIYQLMKAAGYLPTMEQDAKHNFY